MYFQKGHPWIYSILKWKDSAGLGTYLITFKYKYWLVFVFRKTVSLYNFVLSILYDFYKSYYITQLLVWYAEYVYLELFSIYCFAVLHMEEIGYGRGGTRCASETINAVVCVWETICRIHIYLFCHSKLLCCKMIKLRINKLTQYVYGVFTC